MGFSALPLAQAISITRRRRLRDQLARLMQGLLSVCALGHTLLVLQVIEQDRRKTKAYDSKDESDSSEGV
ncbi:MAG TPA: hypothetical protein VFG50_01045 [Rhodothermales bacterium]|nr:hypothetical protein [Rhodothermales bacterium]